MVTTKHEPAVRSAEPEQGEETIATTEGRPRYQRPKCVNDEGSVDENQRLTGAYSLIFQRHAVDCRSLHAPSSVTRRPLGFRVAQ